MNLVSSIRSSSLVLVNSGVSPNIPVSNVIRVTKDLEIFRIHIQCDMGGGALDPANLVNGALRIPYITVNGQSVNSGDFGIKLAIKPFEFGATGEVSAMASDILTLDRRSTDSLAQDNIYVTAFNLSNATGYNTMNVNVIFEQIV